jgi:hypothetical protein
LPAFNHNDLSNYQISITAFGFLFGKPLQECPMLSRKAPRRLRRLLHHHGHVLKIGNQFVAPVHF